MLELRSRQLPFEVRELLHRLAAVVPNLQLFVPSRDALLPAERGLSVAGYLGSALGYGALYAAVLVAFAALVFRRRDLT
jgi:hypothetical protein